MMTLDQRRFVHAGRLLRRPGPVVAAADHVVVIPASVETVFDYVADAGRQQEWNRAVRTMNQASPGPIGVGTRWEGWVIRVGPVSVEIARYDRPQLLVHHAHPRIAEVEHEWHFESVPAGTRLRQHAVMRPKGWGWLMAPLMPLIVRLNTRECGLSLRRVLTPPDASGDRPR